MQIIREYKKGKGKLFKGEITNLAARSNSEKEINLFHMSMIKILRIICSNYKMSQAGNHPDM